MAFYMVSPEGEKLYKNLIQNYTRKKHKNTFRCLKLFGSSRAKCYVFVFKSELLSLSHSPYHITALLQHPKEKTAAFQA